MERPSAYIPMDRRQAILRGEDVPNRLSGAAIFADVSGFTPLTEALARALGPQVGAEELTAHLNRVFNALIDELHRYGGSVMGFAGDAITCWLNEDDGRRATACALAMQVAMAQFVEVKVSKDESVPLAMKAAVAVGTARRFLLGDPDIQLIDVLAGGTLDELADAEHHAVRGEVILAPSAIAAIGDLVTVSEWRGHEGDGAKCAVVNAISGEIEAKTWPELPDDAFTDEQTRPWLLPAVYRRLRSGQGEFLAELRPVTTLFSRFDGFDYDADEAVGSKLDEFLRRVQRILTDYEGVLLHVSFGDKGSYFSASFGAPVAHEDDAVRAVAAAAAIRSLTSSLVHINSISIGIASGRIRTGAYGGMMRRTYGVMGDSVNLAARLMQAADEGQILATQAVSLASRQAFDWEMLSDITVKGKVQQVAVAGYIGPRIQAAVRLQQPRYTLPMVGRRGELAKISEAMSRVTAGRGEIVGVVGEAGIGKSRLIAEVIAYARDLQVWVLGGECHSYAANTSFSVWQAVWRDFFGLEAGAPLEAQLDKLGQVLEGIDPGLLPRMPLMAPVVNLAIPDNELTQTFDAKLRKESLEALLVDCLRQQTKDRPTIFVLEDCHWIDPLSDELLEAIGRAITHLPVLILLSYRIPEIHQVDELNARRLPHFQEVSLREFTRDEAAQLIHLKLNQLDVQGVEISQGLVSHITERAEGNPFYIEELLNYLKGRDIDLRALTAIQDLDLPASLHSLILSRIDQLTESQKGTIKVASVIGRTFQPAMLWGAYPQLGEAEKIETDLEELRRLDLTPLETPEPELTYLFKNVVTQEVAYENLPLATRATIHELIAQYVEKNFQDSPDQYVDLLAFHYERSSNTEKKIAYLHRAGDVARKKFANETAIGYYTRLHPLLPENEPCTVLLKLGDVLRLVGKWEEARGQYENALALSRKNGDLRGRATSQTALGQLLRGQGKYEEAQARFDRAQKNFAELGDQAGLGNVMKEAGTLAAIRGDTEAARDLWERSLAVNRKLGADKAIADLLNNLGILARWKGDLESTKRLYEESLELFRKLEDKPGIALSLNNLGLLGFHLNDLAGARVNLEESADLFRQIGNRNSLAMSLNELANIARMEGDYDTARSQYRESLEIHESLGDQRMIAFLLEDFSRLAAAERNGGRSLRLYAAAAALRKRIGAPLPADDQKGLEESIAGARDALNGGERQDAEKMGAAMSLDEAVDYALELA